MVEILETLTTTYLIIKDGDKQIDDYVLYLHWRAGPYDPWGTYEYYEENNRLSWEVVRLIFDKHIESLDIDEIILTKDELEKYQQPGYINKEEIV